MTTYRAGNTVLDLDNAADRIQLGRLHDTRARLLCECGTRALEMYLARTATGIQVKRMPGTGPLHSPHCISYEPPAELSGVATLLGTAIIESPDTGATILRLGFSMSRRGPQPAPAPGDGKSETATASQHKLSLRGLLHYLWEEARLNHWTPQLSGRRNWKVVHSHLSTAASTKMFGAEPLKNALFIPEAFQLDHKDAIAHRRRVHLARLAQQTAASKNLMIVIAEAKEITTSRTAFKIILKHLPDFHFGLSQDLHNSFKRKFVTEIGLWDKTEANHLLIAATFSMTPAGYANIEEITAMATNANWVPIDNGNDETLLQALTDARRAYVKVLRYGLHPKRPTATVILTDTTPKPVALYVMPMSADVDYRSALRELVASSDFPAWFWTPDMETSIQLPSVDGFVGMPFPD